MTLMSCQVRPNTAPQVVGIVKNVLSRLTEEDRRGFWGKGDILVLDLGLAAEHVQLMKSHQYTYNMFTFLL